MKEQIKVTKPLIVAILNESDRSLDYLPSMIKTLDDSQSQIVFTDNVENNTHTTIRVGDKNIEGPYKSNVTEAFISLSFLDRHPITSSQGNYILYFIRISVLEFLYKEYIGETFKLFQQSSLPKLNENIWMNVLPNYAQTAVENLSQQDENARNLVKASHSIVRELGTAYSLLLTRARHVAVVLSETAMPGLGDTHYLLQYIFMYSDQKKVHEVVLAINNDVGNAFSLLIDLLRDCPHKNAAELLKGLSAARNLEGEIKDYAMKALQTKDTKTKGGKTETKKKPSQIAQESQSEDSITSQSDIAYGVDLHSTDLKDRDSELEPFKELLFSQVVEVLGDDSRSVFLPAWNAVLEADAAISKRMEIRVEKSGYNHLKSFTLALGEARDGRAVAFLESIISNEVADDSVRKLAQSVLGPIKSSQEQAKHDLRFEFDTPIEHVEKIENTRQYKPETIGIAPPAGVTEDKRPKDALGYKVFANALGDLVCHKSTTTPLTIGICARWGRGKSVLLKFIEDRIDELTNSKEFVACLCIDFNAWKYTKSEQLWAEFYTKVLEEVENDLNWWEKTKFRRYFFSRNNPKLYNLTLLSLALTVYSSLLLFGFYQQHPIVQLALTIQWGQLILPWTPIVTSLTAIFPIIWKRTRSVPKQIFWKSHLPKFKEALGVQHEIFKSFEIVCDWLGTPEKKRIVVFIDDIDRCQPDEILQVIESIKLLLDSKNFVFILAMDPKIVRHAIGKSYEFISKKKTEKERLGREYLEKIIQIPFHLPQLTYKELSRLKNQLFAVSDSPDTFEGKVIAPQVTRDDPGEFQVDPELVTGGDADDKLSPDKTPVISPIGDDSEPFDSKLSVEFSKSESSDIDLLLKDNYVISPRLLNRLKNAYLLAKHFYFAEHNSDPPSELIKLLAFSIKYPFESVDIFETMEDQSKNKNWDSIANACKKQNDDEFDSNIDNMTSMLKKHVPDINVARNLSKYVNYFNITAS